MSEANSSAQHSTLSINCIYASFLFWVRVQGGFQLSTVCTILSNASPCVFTVE